MSYYHQFSTACLLITKKNTLAHTHGFLWWGFHREGMSCQRGRNLLNIMWVWKLWRTKNDFICGRENVLGFLAGSNWPVSSSSTRFLPSSHTVIYFPCYTSFQACSVFSYHRIFAHADLSSWTTQLLLKFPSSNTSPYVSND